MFPSDFKELLSVYHNRKIRYLLIGGYAVSHYAQPRTTKDLDLLVGLTEIEIDRESGLPSVLTEDLN